MGRRRGEVLDGIPPEREATEDDYDDDDHGDDDDDDHNDNPVPLQ